MDELDVSFVKKMDTIVHIDESGDPGLSDDCYVICAVICKSTDLQHNLAIVDQARREHRAGAELKSSETGSRFEQRLAICQSLATLRAKCCVMVIRKDRLSRDGGFQFRPSTYKYCQRRLFEKIYRGMNQISVVMDTYGNHDFMDSFETYIDRHFQPTLFSVRKDIVRSSPATDPLLQVADYVGGTVRRFARRDDPEGAYTSLDQLLGMVEVWPRTITDPHIDVDSNSTDQAVFQHCTYAAEEHLRTESDAVLREALYYLLYSVGNSGDGFIYGDEILDYLKFEGIIDQSRDKGWLRQNVIAKLRRSGVPIAASRDGYKIPTSVKDLATFVEFVSQKTLPYLDRVNRMRNSLFIGLGFSYDMLDHEPRLKDLLAPLNRDGI